MLNPNTMGNDLALTTVREFHFSPELGLNLSSELDTPRLGKQVFKVTSITTTEPEPKWFRALEGYSVVDRRKAGNARP